MSSIHTDVLKKFTEVQVGELHADLLSRARTNVVLGSAIFAYLLMRTDFVFVESEEIKTMHTIAHQETHQALVNADFFFGLPNDKQRAAVLMHCIKHIFFMHQQRCIEKGYKHELFEAAADFYVNLAIAGAYKSGNDVKFCQRYKNYFELPNDWLYDERFVGMSVDEIYEKLKEEQDEEDQQDDSDGDGGGSGNGPMSPDSLAGDGGSERKNVELVRAMGEAVISAQQSNRIGDSEGNVEMMIAEMSKPVVRWTDIISSKIMAAIKQRETYMRVSRRSSCDGNGVLFPSYTGNKIRAVFGFDCSGSMGESDYKQVVAELYSLLGQFEAWDVHIVSCDTKLHEIGYYSSENMDTFDDVDLQFTGGGGTNMSPIPNYANDLVDVFGEHIDVCVVITDGYIEASSLDKAFDSTMLNVVVTTQSPVTLKNAESIHAGK